MCPSCGVNCIHLNIFSGTFCLYSLCQIIWFSLYASSCTFDCIAPTELRDSDDGDKTTLMTSKSFDFLMEAYLCQKHSLKVFIISLECL